MKIEIDLNEILTDEFGPSENLAESIRRQVVESVKADINKKVKAQIENELSVHLQNSIKNEIDTLMPKLVPEILDAKYVIRDKYGSKGPETTFRDEMIKEIHNQLIYKPENDSYYRDRENTFTKAIRSIVGAETEKFKKEFDSIVTKEFTAATTKLVTDELRKKFAI